MFRVISKQGLKISFLFPVLMLAVSGCSSIDFEKKNYLYDEGFVPSPNIKSELKVRRVWAKNAGSASHEEFGKLMPAISEQAVFTVSANGRVTAWQKKFYPYIFLNQKFWQVELDEEITGGVFEGYGLVLLAGSQGNVFALNSTTGEQVWQQELVGEVLSPPQANGRIAIIQLAQGMLQALDFRTGEKLWVYKTSVPSLTLRGTSIPVIEQDVVYAGFANGKLVALDLVSGAVRWESNVYLPEGGTELERVVDVDGNILLDSRSVYAASYQGRVVSIFKQNGRPLWKNNASNYLGLDRGLGQIYSVEDDGTLNAYNEQNGEQVWTQELLKGRLLGAPTVQLNYLVVGDLEGYLYWIRQKDGVVVAKKYLGRGSIAGESNWSFKGLQKKAVKSTDFRIFSKSVVKDGILYVQNQYGAVAAYKIIE